MDLVIWLLPPPDVSSLPRAPASPAPQDQGPRKWGKNTRRGRSEGLVLRLLAGWPPGRRPGDPQARSHQLRGGPGRALWAGGVTCAKALGQEPGQQVWGHKGGPHAQNWEPQISFCVLWKSGRGTTHPARTAGEVFSMQVVDELRLSEGPGSGGSGTPAPAAQPLSHPADAAVLGSTRGGQGRESSLCPGRQEAAPGQSCSQS